MNDPIDLRTDVGPPPTDRMREAAAEARTGNVGGGEGPTLADVEAEVADRLGTGAAVFLPSSTMANQIAARVLADRGEEVMVERDSHLYNNESAGLAQHSGLQVRPFDGGERGVPTPEHVHDACDAAAIRRPAIGMLALENTHNVKGGIAIAPEKIEAAADTARERGVPIHLDGARLLQAAIARDRPPEEFVAPVDAVAFDLAKHGAPAGAVLAGEEPFVERARRVRKLFGGHVETTGFVAAPTLEALAITDRLAATQEHAALLADALAECEGLSVQEPETNLVFVDTVGTGHPAEAVVAACEAAGVLCRVFGPDRVRFGVHREVDRDAIETAADRIRTAVADL